LTFHNQKVIDSDQAVKRVFRDEIDGGDPFLSIGQCPLPPCTMWAALMHYEEISDDRWKTEALARGWNAHAVEHLSSLWRSLRGAAVAPEAGRFAVTDTIENIGGGPKTFEAFVREDRHELATRADS
jgi:hypothetical protein